MAWCTPTIEFTKDLYFPGEEVTGRVWVNTSKDMTARGVVITFVGKSLTAWDNSGKDRVQEGRTGKKAEQIHVEMKHDVWQPENDENVFPAGEYEWNFSFELPRDCPPSFETKYGFIRYFVSVNIDVPKWVDTQVEKAITVSPTIDLNSIPGAAEPVTVHTEKETKAGGCLPFQCGPFRQGNVVFTLTSPTLGYVAGQTVTVTGTLENRTTKPLSKITGSLNRTSVFREDLSGSIINANRKADRSDDAFNSKTCNWEIANKSEDCQVPPGATKDFEFSFEIPAVVATIRSSQIIQVEYSVKVTADLDSWLCSDASGELRFIVGNVPLLTQEKSQLPPHTFVKGEAAQCWTVHLKDGFVPQYPYYGK